MRSLAYVLTVLVLAPVALMLAGTLADLGWLGSCFEGGCGYAAVFYVFPLLWLILSIAAILGLRRAMRR